MSRKKATAERRGLSGTPQGAAFDGQTLRIDSRFRHRYGTGSSAFIPPSPYVSCSWKAAMNRSVFDPIARDYEKIHNQNLPPGVRSNEFVTQKAEKISQWILRYRKTGVFRFLDFGCGNGRLMKALMDSDSLKPLLKQERLQLSGHDTSIESLKEARRIVGDTRIPLVSSMTSFSPEIRFDMVVCCNVFHHIPPSKRPRIAKTLFRRTTPGAAFVIWEHNPFNPATRALIRICPFDKGVRLMPLRESMDLFESQGFQLDRSAYVHIFPPRWRRFEMVSFLEGELERVPLGAQYWAMFKRPADI